MLDITSKNIFQKFCLSCLQDAELPVGAARSPCVFIVPYPSLLYRLKFYLKWFQFGIYPFYSYFSAEILIFYPQYE